MAASSDGGIAGRGSVMAWRRVWLVGSLQPWGGGVGVFGRSWVGAALDRAGIAWEYHCLARLHQAQPYPCLDPLVILVIRVRVSSSPSHVIRASAVVCATAVVCPVAPRPVRCGGPGRAGRDWK